jgi:hypothetical protein
MLKRASTLGLLALGAVLSACTGNIMTDGPGGSNGSGPGSSGGSSGTGSGGSGGGTVGPLDCAAPNPPRAPLRRLTIFEYNNTVADLLGDTTHPGNALPSEQVGNGFGNDANEQTVSSRLVQQYASVAEDIAARVTTERLTSLSPCAASVTDAASETACARTIVESFAPKAYRRPLVDGEADEFVALFELIRQTSDFASSIGAIVEAVLQEPAFLYKPEFGVPEPGRPDLLRPTSYEMATRLSYLFWGTMPDDQLRAAAEAGELSNADGVLSHATRMLADPRTRTMVRFFFDNLLPIAGLSQLERDAELFPTFNPQIGALMREETQTFLAHQIFEGPGTWPSVFTADYTFVNQTLANFYGIPGITGSEFQRAPLDATKRLGLLTQAGIVAGTTHSNLTSPVLRGGYVVHQLLCEHIPLPSGDILALVKPPDPYSGDTARERYSQHSKDPVCAGCHVNMDPIGFALENFDPVGLWRDAENGVTIDASGEIPLLDGSFSGPVELAQRIAASEQAQTCFASHWLNFAYGRTLHEGDQDQCSTSHAQKAFQDSGYDVQALLLALTQTDAFLYLPAARE